MKKVYAFLATGFEDVEALGVVDVCRRAGIDVVTVSIMGERAVESAHGVRMEADKMFSECDFADADILFLPGGMPGAANLNDHKGLTSAIVKHHSQGKALAAICAAPMVLGNLGLLDGVNATCYPGFEQFLAGANYTASIVEVDGLFLTGKGPAASLALGYAIVERLVGVKVADELRQGMMYNDLLK